MRVNSLLRHAWRMARREFISGEYRLTVFALIVGVSAIMSISLISSRIEKAMFNQSADLIGGDMVLRSSEWPDPELMNNAKSTNVDVSLSVSTTSMVGYQENFLLSSVRAVDEKYPLKGQLIVKDQLTTEPYETRSQPQPGDAWAEARLLDRLGISLGDSVDVGYTRLTIRKILELEPDRGGDFYSLNPRLLFNRADLERSRLVQPASRVRYKLMLAGKQSALDQWQEISEPLFKIHQRLITPKSGRTRISQNLDRASAFINLGSLMSVILCGIAVSLAASRHARRHIDQVALCRCFGLRSHDINVIYSLQLLFIAIPAIFIGMVLGYTVHLILIRLITEFFNSDLPPASIIAWLSGPITALCMAAGFGLPAVLRLSRTPPARVLRGEKGDDNQVALSTSSAVALFALFLIAWWQSGNFVLALVSLTGIALVLGILLTLITIVIKTLSGMQIRSPVIRSACANLVARPLLTSMQIAGFGLSVFAIALILIFRHDLFEQWNNELPADAPNRFVFDLTDAEKPAFEALLNENGIKSVIYPVVRGRLAKINNRVVQQAVSKDDEGNQDSSESLQRDLVLTQLGFLPVENQIEAGQFISQALPNAPVIPVSVEKELAEKLELKLNDKLEFIIEGETITATITSLRSVNWENFNPNFYMIFPQGALERFSRTWLTSFYLPPGNSVLDNRISKVVTSASIIDVDFVLTRIRRILEQVGSAMELIFAMTVVGGICVFWASLLVTFDEKQHQAALLRALGASRRQVQARLICEQVLIGVFAGILATLCLLLVSWLVSTRVLEISWNPPLIYCILIFISLVSALVLLSMAQLRSIINSAPLRVLGN